MKLLFLASTISCLFILNSTRVEAGATVEPIRPTSTKDLDFFADQVLVKNEGGKLKFTLNSAHAENFSTESGENFIRFSSKDSSGKEISSKQFSSVVKDNKQTIISTYNYIYDKSALKPQQGHHSGSVWQFVDGKLENYTYCLNSDTESLGSLIAAKTLRLCYTLTPSACQQIIKKINELEIKSDVNACFRLSESLEKTTAIIEQSPHKNNVNLMNEQTKNSPAHAGFGFGHKISITVINELRRLEYAGEKCKQLLHLWKADGQLPVADAEKKDPKKEAIR
ncbi:MAG: hypothetical protein AABY64_11590 [Bdellovibrionota bacterium]|mgnify:CR=1 FL=1